MLTKEQNQTICSVGPGTSTGKLFRSIWLPALQSAQLSKNAGPPMRLKLLGEELVADHPRCFRRDQIIYDPWHYLPVLMKKPGALRNGAPFKDWDLPPALTQVRAKLKPHADADRQFVKILGAVLDHGLAAVEAACAEALEAGIASADVILTVLARNRQPAPQPSITTPNALRLKIEPQADCGRYDGIRKIA